MRNVSDRSRTENQSTHFVLTNVFFDKLAAYEKIWKNIVERGRSQMTIWHMRIACWTPKATNTHRPFNTHCFHTATIVVRMCLNVALHVH
jgi:hypothetical protein